MMMVRYGLEEEEEDEEGRRGDDVNDDAKKKGEVLLLSTKLARWLEEVAVTRIVDDDETVEKVVDTYVFPPKKTSEGSKAVSTLRRLGTD